MFKIHLFLKFCFYLLILLIGCLSIGTYHVWHSLPTQEEIQQISFIEPIQVFTRDNLLIGEIGSLKRYPLISRQIPKILKEAFLCVEDKRFFTHLGVDLKSLIRASLAVISKRKKVQGGSTITMQVARNFYLDREKTYFRKFKEILLALKIESLLDKDKILELYLNKIFLGHHNYGIEAAARSYFGHGVDKLSLSEIAILASLPKAPSVYNPISFPEKCLKRRNIILQQLYLDNIISKNELTTSLQEPIVSKKFPRHIDLPLPEVTQMIQQELESSSIQIENFKVITTIDSTIQKKAQLALDRGLENYDRRHSYRGPLKLEQYLASYIDQDFSSSPLIPVEITQIHSSDSIQVTPLQGSKIEKKAWTLDKSSLKYVRFKKEYSEELLPREKNFDKFSLGDCLFLSKEGHFITQIPKVTGSLITLNDKGEILAFVNGLSYKKSDVIRPVRTKRQIGSTFKPFIYALSFDEGYQITSLLQDSPQVFKNPNGKKWSPQNADKKYLGSITLEQAFVQSRNLATLSLGARLPLTHLYQKLSKFLDSPLSSDKSSLLGTMELSCLELSELYLSFLNNGCLIKSSLILNKKNSDNRAETSLFSDKAAYLTRYLMKKALHKKQDALSINSGGKTGTTNEYHDLWFAGFSQDLCSVVWMGFDIPAPLYEFANQNTTLIWQEALSSLQTKKQEDIPEGIGFKRREEDGIFTPFICCQNS